MPWSSRLQRTPGVGVEGSGSGYSAGVEAPAYTGNPVLRYLAIIKAARDFGVPQQEIEAVAGRFDPRAPRCEALADAFADLILARRLR